MRTSEVENIRLHYERMGGNVRTIRVSEIVHAKRILKEQWMVGSGHLNCKRNWEWSAWWTVYFDMTEWKRLIGGRSRSLRAKGSERKWALGGRNKVEQYILEGLWVLVDITPVRTSGRWVPVLPVVPEGRGNTGCSIREVLSGSTGRCTNFIARPSILIQIAYYWPRNVPTDPHYLLWNCGAYVLPLWVAILDLRYVFPVLLFVLHLFPVVDIA